MVNFRILTRIATPHGGTSVPPSRVHRWLVQIQDVHPREQKERRGKGQARGRRGSGVEVEVVVEEEGKGGEGEEGGGVAAQTPDFGDHVSAADHVARGGANWSFAHAKHIHESVFRRGETTHHLSCWQTAYRNCHHHQVSLSWDHCITAVSPSLLF